MDVTLSLTDRLTVFQDIDGDIGGAYARVSFHPAGPHCEIADPLNVERCRGRYRRRKDAEHRGAREAISVAYTGLGHALCSTSLQIDTLAKQTKKETRHITMEKGEKEREGGEKERDTIRSTHSHDTKKKKRLFVRASRRVR